MKTVANKDDIVKSVDSMYEVEGGSPIEEYREDMNEPEDIKNLISELKILDQEIKTLNDAVNTQKKQVDDIEYKLKCFLEENNLEQSKVDGVSFSLNRKTSFKIEDWDEVFNWAFESGNKQVLYHQLKSTALEELLDNGELPESIVPGTYTKLSRRG